MVVVIPVNAAAMAIRVDVIPANVAPLTITQRYDDEMAFLCLLDRLGLGVKERFRLLHDGFDSIHALVDHYGDNVDEFKKQLTNSNKSWSSHGQVMMRAYFNPICLKRLVGVLYYYKTAVNMMHTIPDSEEVTAARAAEYGNLYNQANAEEDEEEPTKVEIPTLTGSSNWVSFRDNFLVMLSMTTGKRGIPIDYVVDSTLRSALRGNANLREIDQIDISSGEALRTTTVHFGPSYKHDNTLVWNKLQVQLIDKPGYNHISSYANTKNGRGAWNTLRSFYEAEDFKQRNREAAFDKLQNTFYKGENARFNFEKYVDIQKTAHKHLQDASFNNGSGLDEENKIRYLRNGIKADAGLETPLSISRGNPRLNTFDLLVSFLTAEVDHHQMRKGQLKSATSKRIAATGQNPRNKSKGSGNRNNKGKRGKNDKVPFEFVDGKKCEGRFYSKDEFNAMTSKQRTAVIKLKRSIGSDKDSGNSNNDRQASSVSRTDFQQDLITLGDAIISGVKRASDDNASQLTDSQENDNNGSSSRGDRPTAESGSVGNLFQSRRSQRRRS